MGSRIAKHQVMPWNRHLDQFIYKEDITIDKDIIDTQPSDFKLLRFVKGLSVEIEQYGDLKCVWNDKLSTKFYEVPQLSIFYEPFDIDELYIQLKYLNCFNGNKHLWQSFIKNQSVVKQPFHIPEYSGKMNNLLIKLLPQYSENKEILLTEWTMKDVQVLQQGIFKNIQQISLDDNLNSKLAVIFVKMKRNACSKAELIDCYKHFHTFFYEYILDKFMQYIKQYLVNYQFTSLEDVYFCMRLIFAIEKSGLPMHLLPSIKSKISNWHQSCIVELDAFEIPFFDSILITGSIGIEQIKIEIKATEYNGTCCSIERVHTMAN